jgi:predicted transcriptional regulator
MPAVLVHLDDSTFQALNKLAPAASRKRTEFIRSAIRKAIRDQEFACMRQAYAAQPDSEQEADDWSTCEEFQA